MKSFNQQQGISDEQSQHAPRLPVTVATNVRATCYCLGGRIVSATLGSALWL